MVKKDRDEKVVNAIVRAINESQKRQGESHSKLTLSESLRIDAISILDILGDEGYVIRRKTGISKSLSQGVQQSG